MIGLSVKLYAHQIAIWGGWKIKAFGNLNQYFYAGQSWAVREGSVFEYCNSNRWIFGEGLNGLWTPPPPFYDFFFADLLDICAFGHHSVVKYSINIKKNLKHNFFVRKQPSPLETFPKIHSYRNTEPFVRPQVKSTI